jgi:hypothetical protein
VRADYGGTAAVGGKEKRFFFGACLRVKINYYILRFLAEAFQQDGNVDERIIAVQSGKTALPDQYGNGDFFAAGFTAAGITVCITAGITACITAGGTAACLVYPRAKAGGVGVKVVGTQNIGELFDIFR